MKKNQWFWTIFPTILLLQACTTNHTKPGESSIIQNNFEPFDYVNPFIGTGGEGHTYPGVSLPFGMVQLSPDTDVKYFRQSFPWCAGYQYADSSIIGFSHTHFSGTGHSDLGDILIMPTCGSLKLKPGAKENPDEGYRSRFSHKNEQAEPGYYQVYLEDYGINVELTATERAGFHRYTFPASDSAHVILDLIQSIYNYDGKVIMSSIRIENDSLVTGYRQTNGWAPNRFVFFAIQFSKPFDSFGIINQDEPIYKGFGKKGNHLKNYPEVIGKKLVSYFNFKTAEDEIIELKVGISGVDIEGALNNLTVEIPGWDFNKIRESAKIKWNKELSKIIIEASEKEKEIFYTAFYHTMLAPTIYCDADKRYRGLDQVIYTAGNYTNYSTFSLWDTYRAAHPLFTIVQPTRDGEMINSMIQHGSQSVFQMLPVWSFQGNESWCMIGYHSVSVIADAYLKGINNFNTGKAFDLMKSTSNNIYYGGLNYYLTYGFVPIDLEKEGASKTLEYAYDDWTIAKMAGKMGYVKDEKEYLKRAANYKNIFDKNSGFMRAKKSDGEFREPFDPLYAQYGGDYTEGNAWQYSWYVPHDIEGLINLIGGDSAFVSRLDSLFIIQTGEDHFEQVEDIAGLIGQYAHGNEPSQHIAYLYAYAGYPWKTQERIHQIMNNLFDNTPQGICGNEDCGQMSAWYIFSSLGFYPVCPGSLEYIFGTPLINRACINLENGKVFTVISEKLSPTNLYINKIKLNGEELKRIFITHQEIMNGGELVFEMSDKPNKNLLTKKQERPYSMSK